MKLPVYYYWAIVAHFAFDLIWQGGEIAFRKRFANWYMIKHCLIMGISSGLVIGIYFQSLSIFIQASSFTGLN